MALIIANPAAKFYRGAKTVSAPEGAAARCVEPLYDKTVRGLT